MAVIAGELAIALAIDGGAAIPAGEDILILLCRSFVVLDALLRTFRYPLDVITIVFVDHFRIALPGSGMTHAALTGMQQFMNHSLLAGLLADALIRKQALRYLYTVSPVRVSGAQSPATFRPGINRPRSDGSQLDAKARHFFYTFVL